MDKARVLMSRRPVSRIYLGVFEITRASILEFYGGQGRCPSPEGELKAGKAVSISARRTLSITWI